MFRMEEIIEKAREYALREIELNGTPAKEHFELSIKKGQELAERLNTDKDIVMLGCILMDLKLGECKNQGRAEEHVTESVKASQEFLEQFDLGEDVKNKILKCVEEHHGIEEFNCKESEICANADCYRFIHPKGVFRYFMLLGGERGLSLKDSIGQVEKKLEEKHNILSLDICKQELEPYYIKFKVLLEKAKE